jgi:hypothetical protein
MMDLNFDSLSETEKQKLRDYLGGENPYSSPIDYISLTVEELRFQIEGAHMAGQADAGVDPGYSNARAFAKKALEQIGT